MYYRKKVIYVPVRRKKSSRKFKSKKKSFRRYKKW